jgi:alpha-glucosidase
MVDWSRHDGIPSVIPAALSMGMSGIGVHHSDLGGFTSLFWLTRRRQLYYRWAELSAFSPVMRSHESNRPGINWQFDADEKTLRHTARMSRVFRELREYRRHVLREYYVAGLPTMRPIVLHYPRAVPQETVLTTPGPWPLPPDATDQLPIALDADTAPGIRPWWRWRWNRGRGLRGAYRYLFGRDLLVIPVLRKGVRRVTVTLPPDQWTHLWTGKTYHGGNAAVGAEPGMPPVFYRTGSRFRHVFERIADIR